MVVLCQRCGVELPDGAAFCRQCGRRTGASWAVASAPSTASTHEHDGGRRASRDRGGSGGSRGNALSALAVFFGVVAVVNVFAGVAALVLAAGARFRDEPSGRFAVVVAGCGAALGLALRQLVFDAG
ncbi:MAG TPA: zinc ribbon domain-containing protein [Acidimicrobiales bacterium]|nr:zinc ribbon domain-containing protein [Acidimicrobiales bacterium]